VHAYLLLEFLYLQHISKYKSDGVLTAAKEYVYITKNTNIKLFHILTIFESSLKRILNTIELLQRSSQICVGHYEVNLTDGHVFLEP
jgi:hypothetical protein